MAIFARFDGLNTMKKVTAAIMMLTLGLMIGNSAYAEKYCKSVDQSGNASYTLAPDTGCKKQFKTVGVRQYVAPVSAPSSTNTGKENTSTAGKNTAPVLEKAEHEATESTSSTTK